MSLLLFFNGTFCRPTALCARARACVREVSACFRVLAVTHHLAAAAPAAGGGVAGDGGGSALVNTFPSFSLVFGSFSLESVSR